MSYIGLFSYYNFDNWAYQPSYVSSNTPWFFEGVRIQIFPNPHLKIEPWFINGWQSYASANSRKGLGGQIKWTPKPWMNIVSNNYGLGHDDLYIPNRGRIHTDNSIEIKYFDKPGHTVDKMAFSLTGDLGCEFGPSTTTSTGTYHRSAVTGGTRVLSDWVKVKITSNPGETFLDRMIALVEGAERQKTPNEIALNILLAGLTIVFLLAVVTLQPFAIYAGAPQTVFVLVSLLVCLIPTTIGGLLSAIGGLLSAIGIAGMDRLVQHNVLAMSGRAVEAAGDVNTLLLDKTGTITLDNREATEFVTAPGVSEATLADSAQLSSLADETPEGRSLVVLAKEKYGLRGREMSSHDAEFIPFSAMTRMSGVNLDGRAVRKGATDAIAKYLEDQGSALPTEVRAAVEAISRSGGTPLVVADNGRALGVIHLKDIVKGGMRQRFDQPRYGDQDLDDYGRQSADGRRDRNRSWSRRFFGPGHAERQARSDSKGTGTRKAGRHDRRRHERRSGVGASRCRGRHEHRHTGSKGSRQHGGPGFESD